VITQQQVAQAAQAVTPHAVVRWHTQDDSLIIINAIGQKFVLPLPTPDLRVTPKPKPKRNPQSRR
jgi:hypothetical protein